MARRLVSQSRGHAARRPNWPRGPHGRRAAVKASKSCADPNNPACANGKGLDVMGYHDGSDISNYWAYARQFVLQDHMFEPNASWSVPAHLFTVSAWSAHCTSTDPFSCRNALQNPGYPPDAGANPDHTVPTYAWTDLTYLMYKTHVSWGYYVTHGYVDHQVLSFDAYAKFIEDLFLRGQRLDPADDTRPDPRPDVRENEPGLGDLLADFDFHHAPRPPILLQVNPHTDLQ